jgi:hypothetical protein
VVKTRHPVRLPAHWNDEDDQAPRIGYRGKRVTLVGPRDTDQLAVGESQIIGRSGQVAVGGELLGEENLRLHARSWLRKARRLGM